MIRRDFLKAIPKFGAAMGLSTVPIINMPNLKETAVRRLVVEIYTDKDSKFAKAVLDNGLYNLFKAEVLPLNPYFFDAMEDEGLRGSIFSDMEFDMLEHFDSLGKYLDWGRFFQQGTLEDSSAGLENDYDMEISVSANVFRNNDHKTFRDLAYRLARVALSYEGRLVASRLVAGRQDLNPDYFNDGYGNIIHGDGRLTPNSLDIALDRLRSNMSYQGLDVADCAIMHSDSYLIGFPSGMPYNMRNSYLGERMWFLVPHPSIGSVAGEYFVLDEGSDALSLEDTIDWEVFDDEKRNDLFKFNAYLELRSSHPFGITILNPQYIIGSVGTF